LRKGIGGAMAFIPSRIKRHMTDPGEIRMEVTSTAQRAGEIRLNLTSMMDMFTIILVFLLKIYSTHGQLIQPSEYLTLPKSTTEKSADVGLDVIVSLDWVLVNNEPIIRVAEVAKREEFIIPELQTVLKRYAREARRMQLMFGRPFSGRVAIQGDYRLPYRVMARVIATCGQSEFPKMQLMVYQQREG